MRTALALALCLAAAPAFAQTQRPDKPEYERVTHHTFDNELVEGGTITPEGEVVGGVRHSRFSSLVKPRTHFVKELLRSAEQL